LSSLFLVAVTILLPPILKQVNKFYPFYSGFPPENMTFVIFVSGVLRERPAARLAYVCWVAYVAGGPGGWLIYQEFPDNVVRKIVLYPTILYDYDDKGRAFFLPAMLEIVGNLTTVFHNEGPKSVDVPVRPRMAPTVALSDEVSLR